MVAAGFELLSLPTFPERSHELRSKLASEKTRRVGLFIESAASSPILFFGGADVTHKRISSRSAPPKNKETKETGRTTYKQANP
jgi:hypothetical protein